MLYVLIGAIFAIFIISIIVVPFLSDPEQFFSTIQNNTERKIAESNLRSDMRDVAKASDNCDVLKLIQLDLISQGARSENWIQSFNDETLRIAQDRAGVLCP